MKDLLIIGNRIIKLNQVDSTNNYLHRYLKSGNKAIEGLVVITTKQIAGKGQQGNTWQSESGKNLTFSVLIKPNVAVEDQFIISKMVSLAIVGFLVDLSISQVRIKWPNDIYVEDKKIAGILIENSIKDKKVTLSIVGIGLNINQIKFNDNLKNATSLCLIKGEEFCLDELLERLLSHLNKNYLMYKANKTRMISDKYLSYLYKYDEVCNYTINGKTIKAKIVGVAKSGKLLLDFNNQVNEYNLKEVEFLF